VLLLSERRKVTALLRVLDIGERLQSQRMRWLVVDADDGANDGREGMVVQLVEQLNGDVALDAANLALGRLDNLHGAQVPWLR